MPVRVLKAGLLLLVAVWPRIAAPVCIPPIEMPHAKVVRVEKNGVIVLADGRAARLEGVLLAAGATDHAPQSYADQAIATLDDLITDHWVALAAATPKEDRYGRLRAQILVRSDDDAMWVQWEILRRGLARVAVAPDRGECAEDLYAAESRARQARAGIWSSPAYAIQSPSQTAGDVGTFQIVEGTVRSVSSSSGRVFLDFGSDRHNSFTATISPQDLKRFREIGVDPFAYANETMRVRGWIERIGRRPEIALATPQQVEIVNAPERR
jgi:endonuclease YncB( thermonuclease family)